MAALVRPEPQGLNHDGLNHNGLNHNGLNHNGLNHNGLNHKAYGRVNRNVKAGRNHRRTEDATVP